MHYKFNKETLEYEKVSFKRPIMLTLFISIGILISLSFTSKKQEVQYIEAEKEINLKIENEFTEQLFKKEVSKYNFRYPDIILAQAYLESGGFESPIFLENNNLFGMKEAKVRLNLAVGTQRGHAYYNNWRESLEDRALYEASYTHKIKDKEQYLNYLDRLYAEDGSYKKKLKKIIGKI